MGSLCLSPKCPASKPMPHLPKTQYTGLSSKHHRVPRDHQVLPEHLVAMVRPGYRVKLAHPGHKVHGDSLVPMVNQVFKVLRALSGHRAEMVRMERMEHVEKLERPVHQVLLANKVCKVLPVCRVPKAFKVLEGLAVPPEPKGSQVHKALLGPLDREVVMVPV